MTYGGSWYKREHKSSLGTGAVIEVNTGLVIDYHTTCKFCPKCCRKEGALKRKDITEEQYSVWKECHAPLCEPGQGAKIEKVNSGTIKIGGPRP